MKIDILFPTLPPALDGIGDHTVRLAHTLRSTCDVCIRTGDGPAEGLNDVTTVDGYDFSSVQGLTRLVRDLRRARPDWVLLQYNPFSYGRWGLNLILPLALWVLQRKEPSIRIALMVHEPFVPASSWRFAVMATWQRAQLWMLGRIADEIFFSIDPWVTRFERWFPETRVSHLPVGSNMPRLGTSQSEARTAFDLPSDAFVLGVFGSAHPSRLLPYVRAAAEAIQEIRPVHLLYVGASGAAVGDVLDPEIPMTDTGALPAEEVSRAFMAMDLYLAPFRKGVSTRRGSFMPGLQHGRPCLSTYGIHTDQLLHTHNRQAFVLTEDTDVDAFSEMAVRMASDPDLRAQLGANGQELYESHFCWPEIARQLLSVLAPRMDLESSSSQLRRSRISPSPPSRT